MTLSVCSDCTTRFAAGLTGCPHCGAVDSFEDGEPPALALLVMTKDELLAAAKARGVTVPAKTRKPDLLALVKAAIRDPS